MKGMNRRQKAAKIGEILDALFPAPAILLHHRDPYTLLIAVLLSAQCTDERVNRVTPELFALAETPEVMARQSVEAVEAKIESCGLFRSKARAIVELSKILIEKHEGRVPVSFEALEALPGVGHKTASVVMAQAFGLPAFPVDTHILRCARRWGLSRGSTVMKVERDLKALFPKKSWIRRHLQIIYFARAYCPARNHLPAACPICSWALGPL